MDFLEILKGGFQTALDIAAQKSLADLDAKPVAEDTQRAVAKESGGVFRAGTMPVFGSDVSLLLIVGGVAAAALVLVLVLRR